MAELIAPYNMLKLFEGLIHRQPLFVGNRLDVDSYHLTFMDQNGQPLNNDAEVPDFLTQLASILPAISPRQKALLTMPESWQASLCAQQLSGIDLTLDLHGNQLPQINQSQLAFADHANAHDVDPQTRLLLINLNQFDNQSLRNHLPKWRKTHPQLCATHVNGLEQFSFCIDNDFDYLEGSFYTLPATHNQQKISPAAQSLMQLLVKLQDPDVEPEDLADIINQDVTLSYKLLRLINSAFFGLPRDVSSTKQAIVMLGLNKIKTWASLLCLAGMDHKPNELRNIAMIRARMCELLAKFYKGQGETFFAAGLFSTLDALMDKPLSAIIEDLPLSAELVSALLEKTGPVGQALQDVLNYERGDWHALAASHIPVDELVKTYLDAIYWSKELNLQLND